MYYVNPDIKNTVRIFPRQDRYSYYRFDMNENPSGLPENFVQSVLKEITPEFLAIYPEQDRFLKKYAKYAEVQYDNLLATNGLDMAIRYLLEIFGEPGKSVVTVTPSFEMYRVNCSLLGLCHKSVSYNKDMTININDILTAIDTDTRIVVLVNPNNPVGNVYTKDELESVIEKAKMVGAVVIVDEAYYYFYPDTFLEYAIRENNVIILRTFSKLFSLAACRLGVIISSPKIISYVKNLHLTFDVNSIALLFGERLLDHPEIEKQLMETEKIGKRYTLESLGDHGYECRDCRGNFIFVRTRKSAHQVAKELEQKKKILVHTYTNELLKDYLRVSIGSKEKMDIFLDGFYAIDCD